MENIEIERTPGFHNADGSEKITHKSANEAFRAWLKATGRARNPENKKLFKVWLDKMKASGKLPALLAGGQGQITKAVQQEIVEKKELNAAGDNTPPAKKDRAPAKADIRILGMKPLVAVGVTLAIIGTVAGIVYLVKKSKKAA